MKKNKYLEVFIKECAESAAEQDGEKFIGWESLIAILVYQGVMLLLPEIKEWLKLGAEAVALKRQEVKQRLVQYASEKELDFPQAERAAEIVARRLDEKTLRNVAKELAS